MFRPDASHPVVNRSFLALHVAQLLGFLNDNILKMMVSLLAVASVGAGEGGGVLSLVSIVFLVPYLLFSGYAGCVADVFGNRPTLIAAKVAEVAIVLLAIGALWLGRFAPLLAVLFLLAAQAAFFSPAKYSLVRETVPAAHLQRANGLIEIGRFSAIILGTAIGGLILQMQARHPGVVGAILLCIATAGVAATLCIRRSDAPLSPQRLRFNPWAEVCAGARQIVHNSRLWPAVVGLCCFEAVGALLLLDTILIGHDSLHLDSAATGLLGAFVGIGLAIGSFLAGRCARRCADIGMVPFGAAGVGLALLLATLGARGFCAMATALFAAGLSAAFCLVPLNAALQHYAQAGERGRIIATNNFLSMAGVLTVSVGLWLFQAVARIDPWAVLALCAAASLAWVVLMLRWFPGYGQAAQIWGRRLVRSIARPRIAARAAALVIVFVLGAAAAQRAEAAPASDVLVQRYRVTHSLLGEIGCFSQTIRPQGREIVVESRLDVRVTMFALVLHDVQSTTREMWSGGKLLAYDSVTRIDGATTTLHGWARPGSFAVRGPGGTVILPADVSPMSPWSIALAQARLLISTETGLPRHVAVIAAPKQRIEGQEPGKPAILARHFVARGDEAFELWYDELDQPVKFTVDAGIGTVSFVRQ
ncbi:MAG TPA: MFS transporter [Dongiaceae bacterium]